MRVLLVERSDARAAAVVTALAAVGAEILRTPGPDAAKEAVRAGMRPDLVVISAALAAFDVAGPAVPRVILAAHGEGVPAAAIRAGAVDAVSLQADGTFPPGEVDRLVSAVEADRRIALGARLAAAFDASPAGSLIVGPDGTIDQANAAFGRMAEADPDTFVAAPLLERVLPEGGPEEADRFRAAVKSGTPWSGEARLLRPAGGALHCRVSIAPVGLGLGAVVSLQDLSVRVQEEESLRALARTLEERSRLDSLCGLYNRAHLHEALDRELSRARRYGTDLAVLMMDLDEFKHLNDAWGHEAGDDALRGVANALREGFRDGDVVARFGGDEFCAILPCTDEAGAKQVAERARQGVAALRSGPLGNVKIRASVGLATLSDLAPADASSVLVRLADRAMLAAKRAGGDRVVAYREMSSLPPSPWTSARASLGVTRGGTSTSADDPVEPAR